MRSFLRSFGRDAKSRAALQSSRRSQTPDRISRAVIEGLETRQLMSATFDAPGCGTGLHHPVIHPPVVIVVVHHA